MTAHNEEDRKKNPKKKIKKKKLIEVLFFFMAIFFISVVSASSYDWNFSVSNDYIFNSTEISVIGGNAYLNQIGVSPYALWHLNELSGAVFSDSSSNSFNGTTTNNPSWSSGKLNNSLLFNGANNFATLGNTVAQFNGTTAVSYSFWFNTTSSSNMTIMSNYNNTQFKGFSISSISGKIQFNFYASNTKYLLVTCNNSYSLSNWHFVVVTYDGSLLDSGVKIYIDSILQPTTTGSNTLNDSTVPNSLFYLARRIDGFYFSGRLDEISIYKKVLSAWEVNYSYNSGSGTESFLSASPLGYYIIQPKNNFTFVGVLGEFIENSTKINSQIQYIVSSDGSWKYYDGASWVSSNGSWSQSNNASVIEANIKTLGNSGNFTFQAILHSDIEGYIPYLDNVRVSECIENWVANYTTCNILDNRTKTYYDSSVCGTYDYFPIDNGTIESCDYCTPNLYCEVFDNVCQSPPFPAWLNCLSANDTNSCCQQTNLSSDCDISLGFLQKPCGNMSQSLNVQTYPYVDLNVSYPIEYIVYLDDVRSYVGNVSLNITGLDGNSTLFFMNWDNISKSYKLTLAFTEVGDYPFIISSYYPYVQDMVGTFLVRQSFDITFCGYQEKNGVAYENDFAYLIAEYTSSKKYYDPNIEAFITPLGFATTFKTPVFHTLYRDGCGTLRLYEGNEEYAVRLFDGVATFSSTFSPPNISKSYGTNIYFGKYIFNGTDDSFNVFFSAKDIHPYRYLINLVFIILVFAVIAVSFFLFFVIPQHPAFALIFSVIFIGGFTILRVIIWFYIGW